MQFRNWLESSGIEAFISNIKSRYPEVEISAYESKEKIELMQIRIPEEFRGRGMGSEIVKGLQDYARSVNKPIVVRPAADKGRKGDLDRFYRRLGFVPNRGRNMDFVLSSPLANTMYWRESTDIEIDDLEMFYRDNEQKVLNSPEIQRQLSTRFAARDSDIRKILGVHSEDPRGNYFVNIFNQRHGNWEKSLRVPMKYTQETKKETPIPEEALLWFRGSKITNENGEPKIVYHGTTEKFDRFEAGEFGFHFGDENAANMMGDKGRFLLRITSPLRLRDLGTWEPERVLGEIVNKFKVSGKIFQKILRDSKRLGQNPDLEQDDDMVLNRKAHYAWSRPVRELIKSLGHDGIVYRNEAEGFSDSYIAFEPDQIRRLS